MTPKKQPSLEDFLQPLEKSFQEAKRRFASGPSGIVSPRTGEAPRSDDRVLISLSAEASRSIYIFNPRVTPYEVIFPLPDPYSDYRNPEKLTQGSQNIAKEFVRDVLYPTTIAIKQENHSSQFVFVFECRYSLTFGVWVPSPETIVSTALQNAITTQIITVPRKTLIFPNIMNRGDREKNIIESAHGYEKR